MGLVGEDPWKREAEMAMEYIQSKDPEQVAILLLPRRVGHLDPGPCLETLVPYTGLSRKRSAAYYFT